jgi:hypothetical protein
LPLSLSEKIPKKTWGGRFCQMNKSILEEMLSNTKKKTLGVVQVVRHRVSKAEE